MCYFLYERVRRFFFFYSIFVVLVKLEICIGEVCEYELDERIFFYKYYCVNGVCGDVFIMLLF